MTHISTTEGPTMTESKGISIRDRVQQFSTDLQNAMWHCIEVDHSEDTITQTEDMIDDVIGSQSDRTYWTVAGQTRRTFNLQGLYGS
jgi:hypothetical protein